MKLQDAIEELPRLISQGQVEMSVSLLLPSREKASRAEAMAVSHRNATMSKEDADEAQAEVTYWRSVINLLDAAEAVGPDNLPDVDRPDVSKSVLMERCAFVEEWTQEVLKQTQVTEDGDEPLR